MQNKRSSLIVRAARLDRGRRWLLVEALATLAIAWVAVRLLPFRRAVAFGAVGLGDRRDRASDVVEQCCWAVTSAARLFPGRAVCIHKGIAAQRLLRRRGIGATLHYGIGKNATEELKAHVWVSVEDAILIGGQEAPEFREVATFP